MKTYRANLYTSNFDENNNATLQRDQTDITYGMFANSILDISDNWILETGLRADYNTDFGIFHFQKFLCFIKMIADFHAELVVV